MEIDEREQLPSPSRKKHRSASPKGGAEVAEGDSKHSRHDRDHLPRHHSKEDREKGEGNVTALVGGHAKATIEDGELEEGEIFEEGEIMPEPANSVFSGEYNFHTEKEQKALDGDLDALHADNSAENNHDLINHESLVQHCEISGRKIDVVLKFDGSSAAKGKLSKKVVESEDSENFHAERNESFHDYAIENGDLGSRLRSQFSRDRHAMKDGKEDNATTYSGHSLGRYLNGEEMRHTPSNRRNCGELCQRDRSRSSDTDSERSNRDDRVDEHKIRSQTDDTEMDRGRRGSHSERERTGKERGSILRERESSSSHRRRVSSSDSKHNSREARHVDRDRQKKVEREMCKEKVRSSGYSRHGRESRHGDHDGKRNMNTGHRGVWDRSSSISSRHDPEREREWERERGNTGDRCMGKPQDISRERYRERNCLRYVDREKERERGRYIYGRERGHDRDQEMHLDFSREHGRRMNKDTVNNWDKQWDYRHSKYDEETQNRDKKRSKEVVKELDSFKHYFQAGKSMSLREEDGEDYQERLEHLLAERDEEDIGKIEEDSRKR